MKDHNYISNPEKDLIDHHSYTQLKISNCEMKLSKMQASTGFKPMTSAILVQCKCNCNVII